MTIAMKMQGDQCSFGTDDAELVYLVQDSDGLTSDPLAVRLWFRLNAPATVGALVLNEESHLDDVGHGSYMGHAIYGRYAEPSPGETVGGTSSEWNFDVGLQNSLETRSKETLGTYRITPEAGPALPPTDYRGSINVTREGVEGAEVPRPTSGFTEVHYYDVSALTTAFKKALKFCVGKVNSVSFRGYEPGEVLLEGISGSGRGRETVQLSFKFAVSENADDLTVGSITGIEKPGHALAWVTYDITEDGEDENKVEIKTPRQVNIERMFDEADFESVCGI